MYHLLYDVVLELLKNRCHGRLLAKALKQNVMTVNRALKLLMKENVVNYSREGKNLVYFVKDSVEARNYVIMAEYYKLNIAIKKYPVLRVIVKRLEGIDTGMAIIFGSYADFSARTDSDIDLYVENPSVKSEILAINSRISLKRGKFNTDTFLAGEILQKHIVIKNADKLFTFYKKDLSRGQISYR